MQKESNEVVAAKSNQFILFYLFVSKKYSNNINLMVVAAGIKANKLC